MSYTQIRDEFKSLQQDLFSMLEEQDGRNKFTVDNWHTDIIRASTGTLQDGAVLERAGVGFSEISSNKLPPAATKRYPQLINADFKATGVSVVVHPLNPHIPTSHFNVRFFTADIDAGQIWWFGGGFDLTPFIPYEEDCILWHQCAEAACQPFGDNVYPEFKKWCDDYFFLKHRNEPRGIGGIFFDDLNRWPKETCFAFIRSTANAYLNTYRTIIAKNKDKPYTRRQREFQLYRRGRYVEFNLLYDRGTLFGLQSGGRAESILISMPPQARWSYNEYAARPSSEETNLLEVLKKKDWLAKNSLKSC